MTYSYTYHKAISFLLRLHDGAGLTRRACRSWWAHYPRHYRGKRKEKQRFVDLEQLDSPAAIGALAPFCHDGVVMYMRCNKLVSRTAARII